MKEIPIAYDQLIDEILSWWQDHQNDCASTSDGEYNVYDEDPGFVCMAIALKGG